MAYDKTGKVFNESGSPFVIRPDQWECSGILRVMAGELSGEDEADVRTAMHSHPISFSDGPKGENERQSTRPTND